MLNQLTMTSEGVFKNSLKGRPSWTPDQHREQISDDRVGSHSALASPKNGRMLMDAAITALAKDYLNLLASNQRK